MQSILHAMVEQGGPAAINFDFVLVVGHFLTRDENIFTFFEVRSCSGRQLFSSLTMYLTINSKHAAITFDFAFLMLHYFSCSSCRGRNCWRGRQTQRWLCPAWTVVQSNHLRYPFK